MRTKIRYFLFFCNSCSLKGRIICRRLQDIKNGLPQWQAVLIYESQTIFRWAVFHR